MEKLTIVAILISIILLGIELPVGQVEIGDFPPAYYAGFILLTIAFVMRRQLKNEQRRRAEAEA